ncbi:formyltransferase family protein [Flavobacterium oreochromis]|uniref:Formyl transferase N-terminal domain-containing protein n=1 Tax=Flavobacterium columnare TaxID=996 RepID=A0A246GE11_9FLAO|nr:formyltransferase family protein [Flavobacterium oreochromis]OWP79625.1 hypothetical protein BWK62_01495 [Flavobacterium oreochromis]
MSKKRIVFLVSGGGGTLRFVYYTVQKMNLPMEIVGILADRETSIKDFAERENIYYKKIFYKRSEPMQLQTELLGLLPDIIITNIHKIIDNMTLEMFPSKFINLHYSLLPSFAGYIGMETIEKAKEQNVGFIGATCHFVNEIVDEGIIIHQGCFAVDWEKDNEVVELIFKTACFVILGGICTVLNIKQSSIVSTKVNNKEIFFSPKLPITKLDFDLEFWEKIKV